MGEEEMSVDDIRQWFAERGYVLLTHEHGQEWRAPYMLSGVPVGHPRTWGSGVTELDAATDARARFEVDAATAQEAATPAAVKATSSVTHGKVLGATVKATSSVTTRVIRGGGASSAAHAGGGAISGDIIEAVRGYGWRVLFEDEPDGSVSYRVYDFTTGEFLVSGTGSDYEDAWLSAGARLRPPSEEVRRSQRPQG